MLLGLAGAERAAAQTCVASVQSEPLAGDSTRKKDKDKKPKRRAPKDGAAVQAVEPGCETDTYRPSVHISPGTGSQGSSVSVSINWRDNVGLDQYSYWISFNGADVTSSFSYGGTATSATSTGTVTLRPGDNTLVAEIWDQAGNHGMATVTYTSTQPAPTSCPLGQYLATYYAGVDLGGSPIQTACESAVDHNWGDGTASGVVGGDNFSARWVGRHSFNGEAYQFTVRADDGVRLWVDGQLLIDRWIDQGPTTYTAIREMTGGEHEVKVEYFERVGAAVAQLSWAPVAPRPLAPAPEPVAGPLPSLRETVRAAYWQILEREPSAGDLAHRTQLIQDGVWSVSTLVADLMKSGEYEARFVTAPGTSAGAAVDGVYRHMWDRPATPGEVNQWSSTVSTGGYRTLVDHIQNDWYPREHFGRDAVPGRPVTRWDARTPLMVAPGHATDASRSLCLSAPAGLGAVYECATLRVAHPLPAIRALNRTRVPTLLYSSEQAHPLPTFGLWVTPPTGRPGLVRMEATVYTGRGAPDVVERRRASWAGSEFTPGQTKHVSVSYGAADQRTGVYDYAIRLVAVYDNGATESWMQRGRFALVNHKDSPFGAGWWLAGLERLELSPSSNGYREVLWIGGDGSTRLYQQGPLPEHSSFWVAKDPTGAADTLWVSQHYPDASYVRRLPGGGNVFFDAGGRHIATEDRLGRHTRFRYEAGRLHSVRVPTAAGSDTSKVPYIFGYDGAGHLNRVSAPDLAGNEARVVHVGPDPSGLVRWIRDPGTPRATDFEYGQNTEWERMTRRVDMRGTVTAFYYDWGAKLATAAVWMGDPAKDIVMRFHNRETRGHTNMGPAVVPGDVATTIDGPRPDVDDRTHFWLDRFGAPWRIVDAGRRETVLTRSDPRFPALVTRMDGPVRINGATFQPERRTVSATHDARGNVTSSTDWSTHRVLSDGTTLYATTRYEYADTRWANLEQPTRVTSPQGSFTQTGYLANGSPEWQQPGNDPSRRVTFQYYTDPNDAASVGQVRSVTLPATATLPASAETFQYDVRGNLHISKTPNQYQTVFHNDHLGRTWRTESPIKGTAVQVHEVKSFDGADRVLESTTTSLNSGPVQTLWVKNTYDPEGSPRFVERWSDPEGDPSKPIGRIVTEFRYDPAGRKVAEVAPDRVSVDSTYYDLASNVVRARTRRGDTLRTRYDALNRPVWVYHSATRYNAIREGIAGFGVQPPGPGCSNDPTQYTAKHPYPQYPTNTEDCSLTVAADSSILEYDALGNLMRADNSDARVERGYNLNGTLAWETLRIRTLDGAPSSLESFLAHSYHSNYEYDLEGRRTRLIHPSNLAVGTSGATSYTYTPVTGEPETVTDPLSNVFRYRYDARGQIASLEAPGTVRGYDYDVDGQLSRSTLKIPSVITGFINDTRFTYDERGKMTYSRNVVAENETMTAEYSGLGHLVRQARTATAILAFPWSAAQNSEAWFAYDALGNIRRTTNGTNSVVTTPSSWILTGQEKTASGTTGGYSVYQAGTGRHLETADDRSITQYRYDAAGNQLFEMTKPAGVDEFPRRDRASWYASNGQLRTVEVREAKDADAVAQAPLGTWEEYRYDALGRRVWVRTRRFCDLWNPPHECSFDTVRRMVWDGDHLLHEIRMADTDAERESDGEPLQQERSATGWDPNPGLGRVLLTHGLGIDQPLSAIRMGYRERDGAWGSAFSVIPLWDSRGRSPYLVFGNGSRELVWPNLVNSKLTTFWLLAWNAYGPRKNAGVLTTDQQNVVWLGTAMEDQQDASGLLYRRNRYYNPAAGRFTQEDPIGFAGGINLYGFANGDPVGYSDPYGLSATCRDAAGNVIPCPEPRGGPPVALPDGHPNGPRQPGRPNSWKPIPGSGARPTKWVPKYPVSSPGGSQPGASWDPDGHWDVDNPPGTPPGTRKRYDSSGQEVDHDGNPVNTPSSMDVVRGWMDAASRGIRRFLSELPDPPMIGPIPLPVPLPVPE